MSTTIPAGYDSHTVAPADHAGLTCRFLKAVEFTVAELPPSSPDFSDGAQFLPLAVALTQFGPLVFTVAARPAFGDGTVAEWLTYICGKEGYTHGPITPTRIGIGELPAVTCDATQQAEGVTMKLRFVLLEDGGRLFQMSAMAPEMLWLSAIEKMAPMLVSLELREVRGTQVALFPPAPTNAPTNAPTEAATANSPKALMTEAEVAARALADDAASLAPDHPVNARLRDRGVGLVPRVLSVDLPGKSARLGAGAVVGIFRIPLGWHAIDDGQRTLVFDAGGKMQINLSQRTHGGVPPLEFARGCLEPYRAEQPDLAVLAVEFDGIAGAGARNLNISGEILDQYFLVRDLGRPGTYLVARVTAASADITMALDVAGDILATLEAPAADAR